MSIPDAAIEAAARTKHENSRQGGLSRWENETDSYRTYLMDEARDELEAAMPAIREANQREAAEAVGDELATQAAFMAETHDLQFRQGILWASLHAREFLTEIWKPGTP